jgi:hypothetical protein
MFGVRGSSFIFGLIRGRVRVLDYEFVKEHLISVKGGSLSSVG